MNDPPVRVIVAAAGMKRRIRLDPALALPLLTDLLDGQISIPLPWLRSMAARWSDKVALDIEAASPGVRVRGEADALGAPIEFGARIDATGVHVEGERRTVRIHLSEVELSTTEDAPGPLADAIRKGMIDTSNPATLIGNMLPLPEVVLEAQGRDIVIDLMRIPAIQQHEGRRALIAAATSYVCVDGIGAEDDAIVLRLGLLPGGPKEAALSTARAVLTPAVRFLWPEGRHR